MALPLVATSIFIYQKYPYVDRKKKDWCAWLSEMGNIISRM
jgi:hypothetical protein